MSPYEVRASLSLASLFALRMLGLFLILPVFAVHAHHLAGGDNHTLVGITLGIYGLTQGMLQLPFGYASDRLGRKRVIIFGLVVFAIGSFIAAGTGDIHWTIVGRGLQGAGAIAAPVMALLADLTREESRTKAMAIVGASIGLMFAISMMAAPVLYRGIGMGGIFTLMGVLSLMGVVVIGWVVPREPAPSGRASGEGAAETAPSPAQRAAPAGRSASVSSGSGPAVRSAMPGQNRELLRLHYGIFALQTVQMSLFVVVPGALVKSGGLPVAEHWKVYLPAVLLSFLLLVPPMRAAGHGRMKPLFLGAVGVMLAAQIAFVWSLPFLYAIAASLLVYFTAFNFLAAVLPSLVTRMAPREGRGMAIGVYNTMQSIGSFVGGAVGGWLMQHFGGPAVFAFGGALIASWLIVAWPMRTPPRRAAGETVYAQPEPKREVGV